MSSSAPNTYHNNKSITILKVPHDLAAIVLDSTCFSPYLPCPQIDDRCAKSPDFSHTAAAVPNHASGMSHQLNELVKRNVLYRSEIWVVLNTFLPHDPNHFFASCIKSRQQIT